MSYDAVNRQCQAKISAKSEHLDKHDLEILGWDNVIWHCLQPMFLFDFLSWRRRKTTIVFR